MRWLAGAALACTLLAGGASAETLKMMTGPQGGSWYPLGGALAGIADKTKPGYAIQVLPGAGIANVKAVDAGKADIGFANSVSTVDAIAGKGAFDQKVKNVCNIATLYPQYFYIVASAGAGIETVGDLKGKRIATLPKGNTTEENARHALEAYGLKYDDLARVSFVSASDAVSLLKDGNIDAYLFTTTLPGSAVMDSFSAGGVKLVGIAGDKLEAMKKINPGYRPITIPAGSFPGQGKDVQTAGYTAHIIARCDLPEDTAYKFVKGMAERMEELGAVAKAMGRVDVRQMAQDIGVPLHPGAERYYKEKGVL